MYIGGLRIRHGSPTYICWPCSLLLDTQHCKLEVHWERVRCQPGNLIGVGLESLGRVEAVAVNTVEHLPHSPRNFELLLKLREQRHVLFGLDARLETLQVIIPIPRDVGPACVNSV